MIPIFFFLLLAVACAVSAVYLEPAMLRAVGAFFADVFGTSKSGINSQASRADNHTFGFQSLTDAVGAFFADVFGTSKSGINSQASRADKHTFGFQSLTDDIAEQFEKVKTFSLSDLLSEVFKKHTFDELETAFSVGTAATTPPIAPNMATMPAPWIFFRVFAGTILTFLVLCVCQIPGPTLLIGSLAVPASILIFFFEINTPKNVSLARVIELFIAGGAVSIFMSLLLYHLTGMDDVFGAPAAGIIEESAKLLTLIALSRILSIKRYPYGLNALLFGAAIGAGFAALENAKYALEAFERARSWSVGNQIMIDNIIYRAAWSPFMHIVWTPIAASAYFSARRRSSSFIVTISSREFLKIFAIPVGLHAIWNAPFYGPFYIKFWLLGFVAWVVVICLIESGLNELKSPQILCGAEDNLAVSKPEVAES